jgi:hypothetical protein
LARAIVLVILTTSPYQVAVTRLDHVAEMNADRNSVRRSGARPALRSATPFCTSMAQRTASTTLRNSMIHRVPAPSEKTMTPRARHAEHLHAQPASKLMKPVRFPPGWVSAFMEASRRYRHYSPLLAHK